MKKRIDGILKSRPSPSMVVALLALVVAMAGTAIAAGPRRSASLPPNSVGAKQLKPDAVTAPAIAPKAVTAPALGPKSVGPLAIGKGSVTSTALVPGAVTPAALAPGAVTAPAIAPAAVESAKLQDGAVLAGKIKDGAVGTGKLQDGAVVAPKIAPEAVTAGNIAAGAVGTTQLFNGSVSAAKIAASAVTSAKLADDSVSKPKIQSSAVGTAQLETDAVTSPKIGAGAVLQGKIGSSSVGTSELSNAIPSASAFKNTNTTWTNNGFTVFHFPSETFDTANLHGASAPSDARMKAPVAGIYQATVVATWKNDSCGGTRSLEFDGRRADDTTAFLPNPYISSTVPANVGSTTTQTLTGMIQLAAGESLEIWGGAGGMSCANTETLGSPAASVTMSFIAPGP